MLTAGAAVPGQFVHVRVPGLERAALRRPFSIFDARGGVVKILYKTVGRGTCEMNRLQAGDALQVIGPLGNGFPLDPGEAIEVYTTKLSALYFDAENNGDKFCWYRVE